MFGFNKRRFESLVRVLQAAKVIFSRAQELFALSRDPEKFFPNSVITQVYPIGIVKSSTESTSPPVNPSLQLMNKLCSRDDV
ncbi:hypothetical protein Moror_16968 [Moniliophthora roreri MCA 2997]|uniref:Uncharacterized protein n=1 Tax=Moniliophthora roreri (strain MCA 2997) TaxID=1381753 RepID=V2WUK3_MONRO|nr:hypothetical protein Moror_16968 [Moniliophthora roreri MCA 2997]